VPTIFEPSINQKIKNIMTLTENFSQIHSTKTAKVNSENGELRSCVINDSEVFREGLMSLVQNTPNIKKVDGYALSNLTDHLLGQYDLIITEIESRKGLDVEIIRHLKESNAKSTVVVYTQIKNAEYRRYAEECGADYFIFIEDRYNLIQHLVSVVASAKLRK